LTSKGQQGCKTLYYYLHIEAAAFLELGKLDKIVLVLKLSF